MNTETEKISPRLDRRVTRTRRHLREALMQLILEKGYDAVTIEDITERAELGRTTFYLHYRDKEDLLLESIEATAQELYQQIYPEKGLQGLSSPQEGLHAIERVFTHAAANSLLYRIILKGGAASKVRHTILNFLSEAALPIFERNLPHPGVFPVPLKAVSSYFAASLLGFLTWWLEEDIPYPPEEASRFFTQLFLFGLRGLNSSSELLNSGSTSSGGVG
ncbi:transcriptional regulator, TetR family [Anaerolinea thermolimosa]|uniref:TetR/AcrR family transcriptional regulator n=1 Tax=Anaerolinea thermolimosa TaxID=229919 RepID=UPI0007859357|nr:TetR/AcrR family transcriptional regulator [Anaerolinea thermolimosa]GAP05952.1 transcriptional regulator, TetR family [Anaerolinea thermolimosa]